MFSNARPSELRETAKKNVNDHAAFLFSRMKFIMSKNICHELVF